MTAPEPAPESLLARLVTRRLSSVNFLLDRLELRFDGDPGHSEGTVLTCEVWPEVRQPGVVLRQEGFGYADALRAVVGQIVVGTTESAEEGLVVELLGAAVVLNPASDDVPGAEIALLRGFSDGAWAVWRPGEGVFAPPA